MAQSINQVTIVGRLGQDPETKTINGSTPLCTFSVATTSEFKDRNGGEQSKTEWHRISVWGAQARPCSQYLHKGDRVCVLGSLRYSEYEQNGVKMKSTEIVARDVVFLSDKQSNGSTPPAPQPQTSWSQQIQKQPQQAQQPQAGWGQPAPIQPQQPQPGWGPMEDVPF